MTPRLKTAFDAGFMAAFMKFAAFVPHPSQAALPLPPSPAVPAAGLGHVPRQPPPLNRISVQQLFSRDFGPAQGMLVGPKRPVGELPLSLNFVSPEEVPGIGSRAAAAAVRTPVGAPASGFAPEPTRNLRAPRYKGAAFDLGLSPSREW
jgi:hypothetical protein